MNPTKKFWYDENSEPPKNYIWVKNDKQYKFSVSERRWKEISSSEESGSSSKEITIDDVVKFIHDNINDESSFPFTNWIDIPNCINAKPGDYCKETELGELEEFQFNSKILAIPHYIIGIKGLPMK